VQPLCKFVISSGEAEAVRGAASVRHTPHGPSNTHSAIGKPLLALKCSGNHGATQTSRSQVKLARSCDNWTKEEYTRCVQVPLGLIFLNFALQCHLLASCGVKILEVSAVAVYNFKVQTSLHHMFRP
jgi:hypothetical protein